MGINFFRNCQPQICTDWHAGSVRNIIKIPTVGQEFDKFGTVRPIEANIPTPRYAFARSALPETD